MKSLGLFGMFIGLVCLLMLAIIILVPNRGGNPHQAVQAAGYEIRSIERVLDEEVEIYKLNLSHSTKPFPHKCPRPELHAKPNFATFSPKRPDVKVEKIDLKLSNQDQCNCNERLKPAEFPEAFIQRQYSGFCNIRPKEDGDNVLAGFEVSDCTDETLRRVTQNYLERSTQSQCCMISIKKIRYDLFDENRKKLPLPSGN